MNNKTIIYSLIILLAVSFMFLSFIEQGQRDYDHNKNWWVLYFNDIESDDLHFVIENHSDKNKFHWSIIKGKNKPSLEGDIEVRKGEKRTIKLDVAEYEDKKITIRVSDDEDKKEIYKDFNN
ncbi:hypothetical protein BMS3Abin15_00504 [bacterium BMS3Abin15]|nr:hypothetical protein BMS3Abin15_00504 [bacterium BMS3Abin15]HDZ85197.1 hypothetical protein [Candidatus Moranbacteria bacterium]